MTINELKLAKLSNRLLGEMIEHSLECKNCIFNHNNCCFFAVECSLNDFNFKKERKIEK